MAWGLPPNTAQPTSTMPYTSMTDGSTPAQASPNLKAGEVSNQIYNISNSLALGVTINKLATNAPSWTSITSQASSLDTRPQIRTFGTLTSFNEAWHLQDSHPPAAQLLCTLGLEDEDTSTTCPPPRPIEVAQNPPPPY
jgi:hypothetical protein